MPQVSARVSDDFNERIEAFADETGASKSDALRTLIEQGLETDRLRTENERLRNNLQTLIEDRETHENTETIVEYVEEERAIRDHEQRRQQASVLTRAKWWFTGMPEKD